MKPHSIKFDFVIQQLFLKFFRTVARQYDNRFYALFMQPLCDLCNAYLRSAEPPLFDRLAGGDTATVEGPFGEGWLREVREGPILAVAGGSGIAPLKSIVETALAKGMGQDIRLYLGVRTEADLYLEHHFQALARVHPNFRFTPVLSHPDGQTDLRTGLVSDAVAEDFARLGAWTAYVAGPPAMVRATVRVLTARGADPAHIHSDEHACAPR